MKQLTCEMCGSTEMVKDGGFFVCQTCGTKYSVEEAKKMMIEGTVDVQGTVRVENQSNVDGLMRIARTAFESENYEKAIDKCDEIISMSSNNYDAWKLKADALVNVSTKSGNAGLEAYNSLMNAFRLLNGNATESQKENIASTLTILFANEIKNALIMLNELHKKDFEQTMETIQNFLIKMDDFLSMINFPESKQKKYKTTIITSLINICCAYYDNAIETDEYYYYGSATEEVREHISYEGGFDAEMIWYLQSERDINDDLPNYNDCVSFACKYNNALKILDFCIQQLDDTINSNTVSALYKSTIYICGHLSVVSPYKVVEHQHYSNTDQRWYTELEIEKDDTDIELIRNLNNSCDSLLSQYRDDMLTEVRQRRLNEYWAEHADEKEQLDSKKAELENKISELQEKKKEFEKAEEIVSLTNKVNQLTSEKKTLGLFKGKQKKAIQAQIDELNKKREEYWNRDSISSTLDELEEAEDQLENVIEQLTMDR